MAKPQPRTIAPRLANGMRRQPTSHGLPPHIKQSLKMIAYRRNCSMSWVLEQEIIKAFALREPKYRERKHKAA